MKLSHEDMMTIIQGLRLLARLDGPEVFTTESLIEAKVLLQRIDDETG